MFSLFDPGEIHCLKSDQQRKLVHFSKILREFMSLFRELKKANLDDEPVLTGDKIIIIIIIIIHIYSG